MISAASPIRKSIVLVGAGSAHLVCLKRWKMRPLSGVALTLVNESAVVPYSAMVPAFFAGDYPEEATEIDLVRLCQAMGVRFLEERVSRIDSRGKEIHFRDRASLGYDALSLNLGSSPSLPEGEMKGVPSILLRPLRRCLSAVADLEERLKQRGGDPFRLVVVGGGASGVELTLALSRRLGGYPGFQLLLLHAGKSLLPGHARRAGKAFEKTLQRKGVTLRLGCRVTKAGGDRLELEGGETIGCDAVLWATQPGPPRLLRESGLTELPSEFLPVRPTLQSFADPALFGAGDCITLEGYPDLPRNGVYAVREGQTLWKNLRAFVEDRKLERYRPQRYALSLLNAGEGKGVLSYGPLALKGRWVYQWKRRIDSQWIQSLVPKPMGLSGSETEPMRCGGCGSKISSEILSRVLRRLEIPESPEILVGCRDKEDAAVIQPPPGKVEVQSVDYFKSFTDDPFLFGRVAALHALSDLYAMNAAPHSALAIVALPYARSAIQESTLFEMLSGTLKTFESCGVVLAGGHTTEGPELALGFSVTGYAAAETLFRKQGLREGDILVLTKPLGSGALLAAAGRGECAWRDWDRLIDSLLLSNSAAVPILRQGGVRACTDVTGFGLAGHLLEMLDASSLSAILWTAFLPAFNGFSACARRGIFSTLQPENAKFGARLLGGLPPPLLFDPQTSGGLLFGVAPERMSDVIDSLRLSGYPATVAIGRVVARKPEGPSQIHLEKES